MEYFEVSQNVTLANGMNEWMTLNTYQHQHLAIEYAERIFSMNEVDRSDLAIMKIVKQKVEW